MRPRAEDIAYGIELPAVYDGVAVWVLNDGTLINRFAGMAGFEHRAAKVQEYIDFHTSAAKGKADGSEAQQ